MNRQYLLIIGGLFLVSLVVIGIILYRGVFRSQGAVPSRASTAEEQAATPTKCQGNKDGLAKCFDCKRDTDTESEVNILDFSCFAKFYGEEVGTE